MNINTVITCPNRKGYPRVSREVCKYHVETGDRICMKKMDSAGKVIKCEVAMELIKKEEGNGR